MPHPFRLRALTASLLPFACVAMLSAPPALAANHREAPLTALDTKADITDWYAFVSYDDPGKMTMILNVDPLLEPANGPNYFPFDPEIVYEMNVDNDFDAVPDVKIQFRFNTQYRLPSVFTGLVGAGAGIPAPGNSPSPVAPGTTVVPPAITALDGPGSEGLGLRQSYSVRILKRGSSPGMNGGGRIPPGRAARIEARNWTTVYDSGSTALYAVPSNAGPRTMPDYAMLAAQGIYSLGNGIKVFAGTVDDPFYIDLGAAFDTLNFRTSAFNTGIAAVLDSAQDGDDTHNFAPDTVAGYNVNSIAIELPIALLTSDGMTHQAADAQAVLGTYGATLRPKVKVLSATPGQAAQTAGVMVQIQRMGNPLINELLIGTADKDKFSMSEPKDDAQFANYFLDPLLARVINAAYGGAVEIPPPPRTDLLPLVTYAAPICPGCRPNQAGPVADLLRVNTGIPPTSQANRKRLAVLAGDFGGFPNGRRVSDDVTDIAARAVVGVLNPAFAKFPNTAIGDGVNANDRVYQESFPYVAFANSGRDSRHQSPGSAGCVDPATFAPIACPTN